MAAMPVRFALWDIWPRFGFLFQHKNIISVQVIYYIAVHKIDRLAYILNICFKSNKVLWVVCISECFDNGVKVISAVKFWTRESCVRQCRTSRNSSFPRLKVTILCTVSLHNNTNNCNLYWYEHTGLQWANCGSSLRLISAGLPKSRPSLALALSIISSVQADCKDVLVSCAFYLKYAYLFVRFSSTKSHSGIWSQLGVWLKFCK